MNRGAVLPWGPHRHYPPRVSSVPRILRLCLLALALVACGAGVAAAQSAPNDVNRVFVDYADNRSIDGRYSAGELRAALEQACGRPVRLAVSDRRDPFDAYA